MCTVHICVYLYLNPRLLQSAQSSVKLNQYVGSSANPWHGHVPVSPVPPCPYGCNVSHTLALHSLINKLSLQPIACFPHDFWIRGEAGMDWGTWIELQIPGLANRTNLPKSFRWNSGVFLFYCGHHWIGWCCRSCPLLSFSALLVDSGLAEIPLAVKKGKVSFFFLTKEEAQKYVRKCHWNGTSLRRCFSEEKLSLLHKMCRY